MTLSEEKNVKKNVKLGAIFGYIAFFLNAISGLLFTPWLILSFGDSNYGVFSLATALINLFLIDFGLSNATTAFLSKYRAINDQESIKKTLSIIYKAFFLIDILLLLIYTSLYFLSPYLYRGLSISELDLFKKCLIIAAIFSLISLPSTPLNGILSAYEKYAMLKLADIIQRLLYVGLATLCIIFKFDIYFVVLAQAISGIAVILFKLIIVRGVLKIKLDLKETGTKAFVKNILLYSFAASLISLCSRISFHFIPNVIGMLSTTKQVTFFGMAATIEGFVFSFGAVISSFFMPRIARINKQENSIEKTTSLAIKVGRFQFIILSLIYLGFFVVGNDFIKIWMHGDASYKPVYYCILVLTFYQVIDAPQSVLKNAIYIKEDKIKYHACFELVGTVINLGLVFLLCWMFDFFGYDAAIAASLSILISRLINFTLKNLTYEKLLGVSIKKYWAAVYFKGGVIVILLAIIFNKFSDLLFYLDYRLRFLVLGFSTVLLFLFLTLIFNTTDEEKKMLSSFKRKN